MCFLNFTIADNVLFSSTFKLIFVMSAIAINAVDVNKININRLLINAMLVQRYNLR